MKQVYIIKKNNPKLLLFFAGWAADETPFKQYCPQGMDYMICYDYRTLDFDTSILEQYRQVNVVAWSMGVWAAPIALASVPKEKLLLIAFNGTITPIGDIDYDYAFIGVNDRIFPLENMKLNFDYMFDDDKLIVADCAHYDEPMFRFLLQDMWSMPIDDFLSHLRELDT